MSSAIPSSLPAPLPSVTPRLKRYALAGTGVRGWSFAKAIIEDFADVADLVALYDLNLTRMEAFAQLVRQELPCYRDFGEMVRLAKPDVLIICTPDASHDTLIELAFAHEVDVIVEKPLTTSVEKLRRIFSLEEEYGRRVRVAFNCRYMPFFLELKKVLATAPIGGVRSVNLEWSIDRNHGAEYFRRWHAQLEQSGGLLVHKATHHFDLVNWLLDDYPCEVVANGSLQVFGRNGPYRGSHCRACDYREECAFASKPDWDGIEKLYFKAEHEDGYLRDRCVYREEIDIHDTMNALVRYRGGAQLTYSLAAYSSSEGLKLSMTGTKGRIETEKFFRGDLRNGKDKCYSIRIATGAGAKFSTKEVQVPPASGAHSGGDERMFADLFRGVSDDPWRQNADSDDGAASCLVGIMANRSIASGCVEEIPTRATLLRRG